MAELAALRAILFNVQFRWRTDTSFASRRVTRVLDAVVAKRGQPLAIRCDNGPELSSRHFLAWRVERQIELVHIQPVEADAERAGREFPQNGCEKSV
jgi:transposase InsO family protein